MIAGSNGASPCEYLYKLLEYPPNVAAGFSQSQWLRKVRKEDRSCDISITYSQKGHPIPSTIFYSIEASHCVQPTLNGRKINLYLLRERVSEFVDMSLKPPHSFPWLSAVPTLLDKFCLYTQTYF